MSSLTRHSLEQIEVAAAPWLAGSRRGTTRSGARSRCTYSASLEALLKAKIGKLEYLTTCEKHMLFRPGRKTWVGRAAEPGP